ncbi:neurexin [Elysia marginata]|uniref:Neurexin n=1 Tax=Elysia marginata TaxID=1093978 RepID=A0AAV4EXM2_9GAST|nr:neurexin [Elysia marginata]
MVVDNYVPFTRKAVGAETTEKTPLDATFLGAQFITYNFVGQDKVMVSNKDNIHLDFRTKQANSLLFYLGNFDDYIIVLLEDGGIVVKVNLGAGKLQREIRPPNVRFDDNKWHQLHIRREAQDLNVEVDGMHRSFGSTTGQYVRLSSSVLYVAGSPNPKELAKNDKITNFKGCMRKVKYRSDTNAGIPITDLVRSESRLTVVGEVLYDKCKDLVDSHPVTFATPESYITVATWDKSIKKGSIAFQFRTEEQGGLMMYSNGDRDSKDYFALEIMDGKLYLAFKMGEDTQKIKASDASVSDGNPHDVFFEYNQHRGSISVDGRKTQFSSATSSDSFDFHGELYVGGVGPAVNVSALPKEIWSAMFGLFYVGCFQDLVINGNMVDLAGNAKQQNRSNVVAYCNKMEPQCLSHPCTHQGKCVEGWNRFTCDCRATGYTGNVCQTAAVTLRFDGTQYLQVTMSEQSVTQAEDISLRFRTMHGSGILFHSVGTGGDSMELYLEKGALYLSIIVGSGAKTLSAGHTLGDDRWHTVIIHRRLNNVEVRIDSDRAVTDHIPGNKFAMKTSKIVVGQTASSQHDGTVPHRRRNERSVQPGSPMLRDGHRSTPGRYSGFIGSMQSFLFNGKDFFHMASLGHGSIDKTAHIDPDEHVVREPVTFKSVDAYAVLPRLLAHDKFSISLQFKTTEKDGLMLYNGGSGNDFFALELSNGFLYYVYNMGEGEQRVRANVIRPLNDNKWHELRLLRVEITQQLLRVDDNTPTIDDLSEAKNTRFDLDGKLYLGGVEKTMYPSLPKMIASRHGFVGCLASLDLNGYLPNVMREAKPITESVGDGCRGPITKCVNDSCANLGRCVQQWITYSCDCDMTSYSGPMCTDESVSYKFGRHPGLITFTYPKGQRPSTRSDSIAFGFQTTQENAVMLRIDSENFGDFIQVEVDNSKVYVLYNMGTINHPIGCYTPNISDGNYHVVRFTRTGANASLQVDSQRPVTKNPTGQQTHTFNNQAFIKIGGNRAHNMSIIKHFEGVISGLVLNGVRISELAKEKDPRIEKEGSVSLYRRRPRTAKPDLFPDDEDLGEMQSTQPVSFPVFTFHSSD